MSFEDTMRRLNKLNRRSPEQNFIDTVEELFKSNGWQIPDYQDFDDYPEYLSQSLMHVVEEIGEANQALREGNREDWEKELLQLCAIVVHLIFITTEVNIDTLYHVMSQEVEKAIGKRKNRRMP